MALDSGHRVDRVELIDFTSDRTRMDPLLQWTRSFWRREGGPTSVEWVVGGGFAIVCGDGRVQKGLPKRAID